jgi:hypothetical protein
MPENYTLPKIVGMMNEVVPERIAFYEDDEM